MNKIQFRSDMTVELIDSMGSDRAVIAAMMVSTRGAYVSGRFDDSVTSQEEAAKGRINFLMANRHGTPFEHGAMMFRVEAPIAVFREWHRHRIGFSYNEESGRYKKLEPVFYEPPAHRPLVQEGKPGHYTFVPGTAEQYSELITSNRVACKLAYLHYEANLKAGIAKEVARGVLPVYIYSSMYVTCNPRSLMAFLSLRSKDDNATYPSFPMWEIEQCAKQMEVEFARLFPITHEAFRRNGSVCP